jgi:hypothetical protein
MIVRKYEPEDGDEIIVRLKLRETQRGVILAVVNADGTPRAVLLTVLPDGRIEMAHHVPADLGLKLKGDMVEVTT